MGVMAVLTDPLASLLVVISVSGAAAMILRRAGLSSITGYILGGLVGSIIGVPQDVGIVISSLGLVILGFEIGAEIGGKGSMGAIKQALAVESISMFLIYLLTGLISAFLGLSRLEHLVLFLIAINTSTGILYKAIQGRVEDDVRSLLLSASVIEDTVALGGLAILLVMVSETMDPLGVVISTGKIALIAALMLLAGIYGFRILGKRLRDVEMLPIIAISAALLYWVVFGLAGISQLLGAFIAGVALSRAVDLRGAVTQLMGLRELGLLLYFSSLGGVLAGSGLVAEALLPLLLLIIPTVIIVKFTAFSTALWILGIEAREAVRVGVYMTSISELGIIIASHVYGMLPLGSLYLLLSIYLVLSSAVISSIAARFDAQIAGAIHRLVPQRIEEIARSYVSRARQVIFGQAGRFSIFLYSIVAMIFTTVALDIAAENLWILPRELLPYGVIVIVLMGIVLLVSIPYIAWRTYRSHINNAAQYAKLANIFGLNLTLLLLAFGIILETYIANKALSKYPEEIPELIRRHAAFTIGSLATMIIIVRLLYSIASRETRRTQS
jgi:Kef-type K+ transport system membrane component KefB